MPTPSPAQRHLNALLASVQAIAWLSLAALGVGGIWFGWRQVGALLPASQAQGLLALTWFAAGVPALSGAAALVYAGVKLARLRR